MPYFITDKSPDCSGWATIKEDGEVLGCHQNKQDAVDHMVAVSLAEDMAPGGERNSDADEVIIVDIDGTLIAGGSGIQKNVDYVNSLYPDYYIYIVTGRPESDQEKTMQELSDAGVQFNDIQFNEDMSIPTAEYKKQTAADILEENPVKLAIDNDAAARHAYASLGIATKDPKTIKADEVPSIRQVSLDVPAYIRAAARKGLDYYGQGLAGDGLVDRTVREARDMARGDITEDKVIRANAWGARHLVDLDASKNSNPDDKEFPGAGAVAFYLWGINPLNPKPAMDWFMAKAEAIKADGTDTSRATKVANMERRDLNENFVWTGHQQALYSELEDIADTFGQFDQTSGGDGAHYFTENPFKAEGLMCANCAFYDGAQGCDLVSGVILPDALCKFWIIPADLIQTRSVPLTVRQRELNLIANI
jgi:hypothetical protein